MKRHDFPSRLALARALIAHGASRLPGHLADQLEAAGSEARTLHDRMGAVLPILEPERQWHHRSDSSPSTDTKAFLLAAVLGSLQTVCCHLRKGGVQPAFVNLALRRIDCIRCSATIRRPPPDEADRCDVCGIRGVVTFALFALRMGSALVAGDACLVCAATLGIVIEEAAS